MLFMTEFWERFAFYSVSWALALYIVAQFYHGDPSGQAWASKIYGAYTALIYATGIFGGYIADTIGVGTPLQAQSVTAKVADAIGLDRVAIHFHDTYGQALANILACLEIGVTVVDSAVAGLGGCPYAKGATGNVASEDVVYMLHGMGIETGVDIAKLAAAGALISAALNKPPSSRVARART